MLLRGKNAIVTGAAAGIGLGVAERMAEEGANLILADIDETGAELQIPDASGL